MAFCNSCGAPLNEGTKFCNKCGNAVTGAPAAAAQPITPAPPPSKGGSSALKMVLIIVGVIVLIGILGVATIGIVGYRIAKSAHVSQKGDNVKVETPFGSMETSTDPDKTAEELGVEIYPGAAGPESRYGLSHVRQPAHGHRQFREQRSGGQGLRFL